jgi:hypothetical protein
MRHGRPDGDDGRTVEADSAATAEPAEPEA